MRATDAVMCPRCGGLMRPEALAGHHGQTVTIDLCGPCQGIWFDGHELLALSPAGTLQLFEMIGTAAGPVAVAAGGPKPCPRCRQPMAVVQDQQRATRFEYQRCAAGHGRLMTFYNFLRAKDFISPMTPAQLADLRARVASVQCSNCGAPVDLARGTSCGHCGSVLGLLDLSRATDLVETLQRAASPDGPVDPALPLARARARRQSETAFEPVGSEAWYHDASRAGLVGAGVLALARWLGTRR